MRIRDLDRADTEVNYIGPVIEDAWIEPGDVIIGMDGDFNVARWRGQRALLNQRMCCLRPGSGADAAFISYLLPFPLKVINDLTYSTTVKHLSSIDVRKILLGAPPEPEQRAIAAFLDRETAKIDALAAKKEQLLELLQEKRAALITRAVTKGLDPNVPPKDCGVDWLGQIPGHWECLALSRASISRCDGPFGSGLKSEHYSIDGVRVVRLQNIGYAEFSGADAAYIDEAYARTLGDHSVLAEDLLIAGLGDEAHPVGRACVAPEDIEPAIVKADCFRFRIDRRRLVPKFAAYQLSATAEATAGSLSTGATRSRMNLTSTAARKIALPPLDEQQAIIEFVLRETTKIDAMVANVREAIERFKELRAALISAAVTGKIDVREEAA